MKSNENLTFPGGGRGGVNIGLPLPNDIYKAPDSTMSFL